MELVRDTDFLIEVDGANVDPGNVDSIRLLALASSYLQLVVRLGAEEGVPVSFKGLRVIDKCVAIKVEPNDPVNAQDMAEATGSLLAESAEPPKGLAMLVQQVQQSVRQLPKGQVAKVIMGPWQQRLQVPLHLPTPPDSRSIEVIRARVMRTGGKTPTVRIQGVLSGEWLTLEVTSEQAQALGRHLYGEAEFDVVVWRSHEGRATKAKLMDFEIVDASVDPTEAWRKWFAPHAVYWDQVEDIEEELRRDRRG